VLNFKPILSEPSVKNVYQGYQHYLSGCFLLELSDTTENYYAVLWLFSNGVLHHYGMGGVYQKDSAQLVYADMIARKEYYIRRNPLEWGTWEPSGDTLIVHTHKLGGGGRVPTSTVVTWKGKFDADTLWLYRVEGKRRNRKELWEKWVFHPTNWKPDSVNYVIKQGD
jgi:hypothetical protein